MKYTKPQLLNTKTASAAIMGAKIANGTDSHPPNETNVAYRSDE